MVDHGIVDEAQFYRTIADALGTTVIDLDAVEFTPANPAPDPSRTGAFTPRLADRRGGHGYSRRAR